MLSILEAVSTQEKFSSCIALYFQVCLGGSFFPLVVAVAVNSLPVVLSLLTAFYLELCQTTSERILPEESGQVQPLTLRSNRSHSMMELVLVVTVSSLVKSSNDLGKSGQALYIYGITMSSFVPPAFANCTSKTFNHSSKCFSTDGSLTWIYCYSFYFLASVPSV